MASLHDVTWAKAITIWGVPTDLSRKGNALERLTAIPKGAAATARGLVEFPKGTPALGKIWHSFLWMPYTNYVVCCRNILLPPPLCRSPDSDETERFVGHPDGLLRILHRSHQGADAVDVLGDDVGLLVDRLEAVELFAVEDRDRLLEDPVLPEIRPRPAEILGVLPELGVALDPHGLADEPDPAVVLKDLQHLLAGGLLL